MGELTDIDRAIDRLDAAYRAAGFEPLRSPDGIDAVLGRIRAAIAPLRLPADVERYLRRVDPASVDVHPYPHPTSADFCLDTWETHRVDNPGMTPLLLFPICYESHGFLLVELEDGRGSGGTVLEWDYGGSPFQVLFPSLAAYLDLIATMVELEEYERGIQGGYPYVRFDPDDRWHDAAAVRLTAAQPLPGFGYEREIDGDPRSWPEHWLRAQGLTPDVRGPRGADATIAQLLRQAEAGVAGRGTIRARVVGLVGSAEGSRASVSDGTGVLDIWCPAPVTTFGPVMDREFEFDVVLRPEPTPPGDWELERRMIQERAMDQDLDGAAAFAAELYRKAFQTPAPAEATAVRPVD